MKVHDEIETLTDVYLAGGLEAGARAEVDGHAASCAACARVLRDATAFHGWVKGSSAPGAPPTGLEDRIIANLRAVSPGARRWPRSPRLVRMAIGVAAVFALILIGGQFTQEMPALGGALVYDEKAGHEVNFRRLMPGEDAMSGLRYEASGRLHLETLKDSAYDKSDQRVAVEKFRGELEKKSELSTEAFSATGVGGGGGGAFRGRTGGRDAGLKNWADKKPAATPAPAGDMADSRPGLAEKDLLDHNETAAEGGEESLGKKPPGEPFAPGFDDRKIIRNADIHLEVLAYGKAVAVIGEIVKTRKGFIAGASTTLLANGKTRGTVTLRVPPEMFEETLAELAKLGAVRHQAISTQDVTKAYADLASRLESKKTLIERLKKVLLEGKGTVKELMEVEVQMSAAVEQMELIKGEMKYYDNLVGMSTITIQLFEKDLGLPFEYVQTLQSVISITDPAADAAYAAAHKVILDAGGQVAESRMSRANDDSSTGFVRGKVDAHKFPEVRDALKKLGKQVDQDTVNQQQTGRGGEGAAGPGATVRREQAVIDFTVNTPPVVVTRRALLAVEASPADGAYQGARRDVEAAKGEILGGSITDKPGGASAFVRARVDKAEFAALVEKLKALGKVKNATVKQDEPASETGVAPLLREKGEVLIEITTPAPLIPEESGLSKVIRDTFGRSVAGLLWSAEKLFVGVALAGPWIVLAGLVLLIWKRSRRSAKPPATPA